MASHSNVNNHQSSNGSGTTHSSGASAGAGNAASDSGAHKAGVSLDNPAVGSTGPVCLLSSTEETDPMSDSVRPVCHESTTTAAKPSISPEFQSSVKEENNTNTPDDDHEEEEFGILAMQLAIPPFKVPAELVEESYPNDCDNPQPCKTRFKQEAISAWDVDEDSISLALTALRRLMRTMRKEDIRKVGRLEVGTESNLDMAKSIKSYLTELFVEEVVDEILELGNKESDSTTSAAKIGFPKTAGCTPEEMVSKDTVSTELCADDSLNTTSSSPNEATEEDTNGGAVSSPKENSPPTTDNTGEQLKTVQQTNTSSSKSSSHQEDSKSVTSKPPVEQQVVQHPKTTQIHSMLCPNLLGVDNVNACYGGTAALLNSLDWLRANPDTAKLGIVVVTDTAEMGEDSVSFQGAGAVAMLVGSAKWFGPQGDYDDDDDCEGDEEEEEDYDDVNLKNTPKATRSTARSFGPKTTSSLLPRSNGRVPIVIERNPVTVMRCTEDFMKPRYSPQVSPYIRGKESMEYYLESLGYCVEETNKLSRSGKKIKRKSSKGK